MKKKELSKYNFIVFVTIAIILAFLVIKPFIRDILSAVLIAYIFYPVYKSLNKWFSRSLSSFIVCILVVLTVTIPLAFVFNSMYDESVKIYTKYRHSSLSDIFESCHNENNPICTAFTEIKSLLEIPLLRNLFSDIITKIPTYLFEVISHKVISIPRHIIDIFIILFITYYLLKQGNAIYEKIIQVMPFKESHQKILFSSFKDVTYAVVYGHIIVALIQGIIGTIVFMLVGIPSPILLGSIMTITALIPFLGAAIVWLSVSLFAIISGIIQNSNPLLIKGIIIFIAGIFISTFDNFARPRIIGSKADIHPVIVLLGVLGGLALFGLAGIIIGPVILSATKVIIELYLSKDKKDKNNNDKNTFT